MKVFIYTIPRESVQKIHEFKDTTTGKKLNKTKNGRNTGYVYSPIYTRSVGGLQTGLLDMVDNPYYIDRREKELSQFTMKIKELESRTDAKSKETLDKVTEEYRNYKRNLERELDSAKSRMPKHWEYLVDKKEITRQELLEYKHGRVPNFYTNKSPFKLAKGEDPTYMQTFTFRLNDGLTVLDTAIPEHELTYYCALKHKYVAPSKRDWLAHKKPFATHYLSLQEEDDELIHSAKKVRNKALAAVEDEGLTTELKIAIIKALDWQKGEITEVQAYNLLTAKIENADYKEKNNDAAKFMELYEKSKTPTGREELYAYTLLSDLAYARVISVIKDTYTWVSKGIVIGYNRKEAVDFLMDPNKAEQIKSLKGELRAKFVA